MVAHIRICNSGCLYTWPDEVFEKWAANVRFQTLDSTGIAFDPTSEFNQTVNPLNGWSYSKYYKSYEALTAELRTTEIYTAQVAGCYNSTGQCTDCDAAVATCQSLVFLDISPQAKSASVMNIVKTLVMIFVMAGGSIMFTRDAQIVVIGPIERMVSSLLPLFSLP